MRVKAIAFALLTVSGTVSARLPTLPPLTLDPVEKLSYRLYTMPKDLPSSQPCGPYGQQIMPSELSNSSVLSAVCADLGRVWGIEPYVIKANYYTLQENEKMGSPMYGCALVPTLPSDLRKYPALCRAKDTPDIFNVYLFQDSDYRNDDVFAGQPDVVPAGESMTNVSYWSFKVGPQTMITVFPTPDMSGGYSASFTESQEIAPFEVRSFRVIAID